MACAGGSESTFKLFEDFNHMVYFELNLELVDKILTVSKRVQFADD
ncbi:MAG: hypothetical protein LBP35_02475 [Candidatus Ancillula trichonymphae]|jgi:hypothetical protein|nr:hypothetical protein [Candidatus Ancillula trichonymphae]